jgi:hypothetical protein
MIPKAKARELVTSAYSSFSFCLLYGFKTNAYDPKAFI